VSGLTSKPLGWFSSVWPQPVATVFVGLVSKPVVTISGGLVLKPAATVSSGLVLKLVVTVSGGLASKPALTVSSGLALKPITTVFTGLASKPVVTVFSSLTSKLVTTVSPVLASKLVTTVSPGLVSKPVVGFLVEPQNQGGGGFPGLSLKTGCYGFGDLDLKITATVSWFGHQNKAGFGLSVVPQNRWREVGAGDARDTITEVASEAS
jgi:hypothetical protein